MVSKVRVRLTYPRYRSDSVLKAGDQDVAFSAGISYSSRSDTSGTCPIKFLNDICGWRRLGVRSPLPMRPRNRMQVCWSLMKLTHTGTIDPVPTRLCQEYLRKEIFCWRSHQKFTSRRYSWERGVSTSTSLLRTSPVGIYTSAPIQAAPTISVTFPDPAITDENP